MATHNGIIETATGDLLEAGFVNYTAGAGESVRTDVPEPAKVRGNFEFSTFHRWNGSAWEEVTNTTTAPEDLKVMGYSFDVYAEMKSSSYVVGARIVFPGTHKVATPSAMVLSYLVKSSSKPGSVRIYDITNSQVICEKTNLTNTGDFELLDMGTLANLPTDRAVFELQGKTTNNGHYIRVAGLTMEF